VALPPTELNRAFRAGRLQIGLWRQLTSPGEAGVPSRSGFDLLVIEMEHALNELPHALA
jgi:2-keto-3-deoxy-L-rhamnonate aldolase RhmA